MPRGGDRSMAKGTVYRSKVVRGFWRRFFRVPQPVTGAFIDGLSNELRHAKAAVERLNKHGMKLHGEREQARSLAARLMAENGDYEDRMTDARRLLETAVHWSDERHYATITAVELGIVLSRLDLNPEVSLNDLLMEGP